MAMTRAIFIVLVRAEEERNRAYVGKVAEGKRKGEKTKGLE